MNDIFGVPAHPLVVHAAVVLLPLAVLLVVVTAALPGLRRAYAPLALLLALAALGAVFLAQESGESLEERVRETEATEEHAESADVVLPWALGVTVVAGALALFEPAKRRWPRLASPAMRGGLVVVALLIGTGATAAIVDVGHSGAKATWGDTPAEDGDEDEGDDD